MKRQAFVRSLIALVGVSQFTHVRAALALDEAEMGRQVFAQLRESGDILFDSSYYEHLNEIGSVIAAAVRTRYEYPIRFYIVRGDSANAFAVPGGNIYVNEPLLKLARNRDELAGVLAHEAGHMVKHHVAQRIAKEQKLGLLSTIGSIAASVLGGWIVGNLASNALDAAAGGVDANISRHIESEADEEGARIMAATKTYNPYGMIWFFQVMSTTYGPGQKGFFTDHPVDATRIADLKRLMASDPATFGSYTDTQQREVAYW